MSIPVLVRSVGPEPSAGYYTQWTTFVPGYPKFKNQDTGVTSALYNGAAIEANLVSYRAHHLYFTGMVGEIVDRLIDIPVPLPGVGEYYDIPVTAYDPGSTGFSPDAGSSQGTAQPSGPARLDITVSESFALSTGDAKVTPWHTPHFVREREITGERWANLFGATQEADGTTASRALSAAYETQLVAQDFRFSLPSTAAITGVEVEVNRRGTNGVQEKVSLIRCYGRDVGTAFVAIGYSPAAYMSSPDGAAWTAGPTPTAQITWSLVWNGDIFCAIPQGGFAITSTDGVSWETHAVPISHRFVALAWNGDIFCGLGLGTNVVLTSPDGTTWTQATLPVTDRWVGIAWNGSVFCALTDNSSVAIISADGETWTQHSTPLSGGVAWHSLVWNGSVFCAINENGNVAITSADGVTWTQHTIPVSGWWSGMVWNGYVFCALSQDYDVAITSQDGITWSQHPLPVSDGWTEIAFDGVNFCALSHSWAMVSQDGIEWTPYPLSISSFWGALAFGGITQRVMRTTVDEGVVLPDGATYTCEPIVAYSDLAVPTNYATNRAGGDGELFSHVWTAQEINSESFGVIYEAKGAGGLAALDAVRVRVHYRADPTTDTLPAKRSAGLAGVAESPSGVKVAVGVDGKILRKPANNPTWASVASGTTVSLNAVEWVGDRFVAVGMFGMALDGGADGSAWTRIDTGAVSSLWSIKRVPNSLRAVAVGNDDYSFERGRNGGWTT